MNSFDVNYRRDLADLFFMNCRRALADRLRIEYYKLALAKFLFGLKPNFSIATENRRLKHDGN